jgi:hypothetical protein
MIKNLEGHDWKLGDKAIRRIGKWIGLSEWVKFVQTLLSNMNVHQRVIPTENFNNQVMTDSVDTRQLLSVAALLLPKLAHEQSGHVGRNGGFCTGLPTWTSTYQSRSGNCHFRVREEFHSDMALFPEVIKSSVMSSYLH